jgi:hypothetical protein
VTGDGDGDMVLIGGSAGDCGKTKSQVLLHCPCGCIAAIHRPAADNDMCSNVEHRMVCDKHLIT